MAQQEIVLGEFRHKIDEKHRLVVPADLVRPLGLEGNRAILAKERSGCISLWEPGVWHARFEQGVELLKHKVAGGMLDRDQYRRLQMLGRLLSTRHAEVTLDRSGRLGLPDAFRVFLGVKPGDDLMIVGAAVCVEIWTTAAWQRYVERRMPRFRQLFDQLAS